MKTCRACGIDKNVNEYGSIGYGKKRAQCRNCYNSSMREYSQALPFRKRKDIALRRTFGINIDEYEAILDSQNGVCAVCHQTDKNFSLGVDHNHITGEVRGLLCNPCNRALGLLKEDVVNMENMISYTLKYEGDF